MSAKYAADRVKAVLKNKVSSDATGEHAQMQSHQCNLVKIPRMPCGLSHIFPQLAKKITQRKAYNISSELNKTDKHSHASTCNFENAQPPGADLIPSRVKRWQLREYHIVARKIRALSNVSEPSRKYEITLLNEQSSQTRSQNAQDALWEEMIKAKEERQFQIGRITKYFS